ncbi:hypothetical protein PY365_30765 [Roseiarcaceae bacterium H3SJ34-1]|uniref:hypothetical protein n=1 Tax=Terripilifer ovatus TaxID=3032367 RepID=UPI003AB9A700|nr:hypothetical protein [Roseiarcaceae bacterium H3SJ34-1]
MTDRTELIQRLRLRAVEIHRVGDVARAQLIGRTIELLLYDEHPSFGRAVASELKLAATALKDQPTRALIHDALRELEP